MNYSKHLILLTLLFSHLSSAQKNPQPIFNLQPATSVSITSSTYVNSGADTGTQIVIPENGQVGVDFLIKLNNPDYLDGTLSLQSRTCSTCSGTIINSVIINDPSGTTYEWPTNSAFTDVQYNSGHQIFAHFESEAGNSWSSAAKTISIEMDDSGNNNNNNNTSNIHPVPLNDFEWNGGHGIAHRWDFADIFGEDRELYVTHRNDGTVFATKLNENGTLQNYQWFGAHGIAHRWTFADIFGTGQQLYITHRNDGTFFASQFNANGTVQNYLWSGGHGIAHRWWFADIFGTGRKLYVTQNNNGTFFATQLNQDGTINNYTWFGGQGIANQSWFADIDGSGKEVFVTHSDEGDFFATQLNSDGSKVNKTWTGGEGTSHVTDFVDIEGNGQQVFSTLSYHDKIVFLTKLNADGTLENAFVTTPFNTDTFNRHLYTDFLGIGRTSFVAHKDDGEIMVYTLSMESNPRIITNYYYSHGIAHRFDFADIFGNGKKVYVTHRNDGTFFASMAD